MKKIFFLISSLISISSFAQFPNYVPTDSFIGFYPFNSNDLSGNGNNGTISGATL
jgi:hypothetical protein